MMSHIRRYFVSGLLFWLPIWVTILVFRFFIGILDNSMSLLPAKFQPEYLLGFHIPGLGVILVLLLMVISGAFVANILGKRMVSIWDRLIGRIPLVRSIYNAVKQTAHTLFSSSGQSFRSVYLVEYPRKGLWSVAFQTGDGFSQAGEVIGEQEMLTIFIPTTPNPTSGFLMVIPRKDAHELNMSVEQALKFVISLGVVQPGLDHVETKLTME